MPAQTILGGCARVRRSGHGSHPLLCSSCAASRRFRSLLRRCVPVFRRRWERFRADEAARRARAEEAQAANRARIEEAQAAQQREREVGIETGWPPELVLDGVVEWMTRNGWALQNRTEGTATFARDVGVNACLGCFLTLLFILPGILYFYLYNRAARITVAAYSRRWVASSLRWR